MDVFNFHPTFCYLLSLISHSLARFENIFLKMSIKSGNITEKKNKTLKDFLYFLIPKRQEDRMKLNSVRSLWLCGKKNSHRRCSVKKVFLEILQNSEENTCARASFFNKAAGLAKFLRAPFLTSERLLPKFENNVNSRFFQTHTFE